MVYGTVKKAPVPKAPVDNSVVITRSEHANLRSLMNGELAPGGGLKDTMTFDERRRAIAAERRAKMQAIDEERRQKGAVKPMEEIEKEANRQEEIGRARKKLDEEIDEVKHMNQVMLYAKCVTVRDAQIMEKSALKSERAEEDRRMDMMMELERLKALRMYEEREVKRIEDRKKGAAVLRAQIEEREQERLRKLELKQQEQDAMLRHIERMRDDDRLEAVKKKEGAKRLMEDVALANAEQIRLKNRQREMEQEEERQIADYIKEKETRDQEVIDEQRRVKAEKEKEIARLRAQQEKAQDKQAELDALRARRAQEAYDRDFRQKERDAANRVSAINADLKAAREKQKMEKEMMLAEQGRLEKEEFERIIAVQRMEDEVERGKLQRETNFRRGNADALKKQITEIEEARKKERRDFLEEGNKLKMESREREAQVDAIRGRKLEELDKLSVPKQYRQELLKKKAGETLRPSL